MELTSTFEQERVLVPFYRTKFNQFSVRGFLLGFW